MPLRTLFVLFAAAGVVAAQAKTATSESVQALRKKFDDERAGALTLKFPESALARADELAKRSADALAANEPAAAERYLKEARWLVPYVPSDLPPHVDRVLGIARMRHGDIIHDLAFSPDGTRLATISQDATVKIWDLGNGRELRNHRGEADPAEASNRPQAGVSWSADGKWIASTAGNSIHVWDADTGKLRVELKGHEKPVSSLAFSPDGTLLVSGSKDQSVRLWTLADGKEKANLNADFDKKVKSTVRSVAFSPNGKLVASINDGGVLHVWNPSLEKAKQLVSGYDAHSNATGFRVAFGKDTSVIFTTGSDDKAKQWVGMGPDGEAIPGGGRPTNIEGHSDDVTALAVSRDGRFLATGGQDKTIRLYDMSGGTARIARVFQGHGEEVSSLAFSSDGSTLASASHDQSVRLWRVSLSDDHANLGEHTAFVWTAAVSPDGKLLADAGADKTVYLREANGKVLHKLEGATAPVTAVAFNADGSRLVAVGGDAVARVYTTADGKLQKELKGHTGPIMAVAFGGKDLLLTGGLDKVVRLWNLAGDAAPVAFPAVKSIVSALGLRPDGKQAAVGTADGMLRLFDLAAAPKETAAVTAHLVGIGALSYSTDGTKLATGGGDGLVKSWNLPAGAPPVMLAEFKAHTKPVSAVAFDADARFIVSGGGDQVVRVFDLTTKTELRALRGHGDWVTAAAFGPNGRTIVSASVDKTVKVWELTSEETAKPVGHTRALRTIAVSADGRWVASGSEDRTIKIWDAVAGTEAFTLDAAAGGHDDTVTAVCFDPTGKKLASGGNDKKIILWDLETRKPSQTLVVGSQMPYMLWTTKGDKLVAWQTIADGGSEVNNFKTYDPDGKQQKTLDMKDREVRCTTFSSDGEMAALGFKDGSVQLWNLLTNERVGGDWAAFKEDLGDMALTPDKKRIIASDSKCNVKLYDIEGKKVLKEFVAHQGAGLNGLLVGPTGTRFATISDTGEVKLWDAEKGEELRSWVLPTPVRNIAFSADGKKLITANGDTTLYVLNLP